MRRERARAHAALPYPLRPTDVRTTHIRMGAHTNATRCRRPSSISRLPCSIETWHRTCARRERRRQTAQSVTAELDVRAGGNGGGYTMISRQRWHVCCVCVCVCGRMPCQSTASMAKKFARLGMYDLCVRISILVTLPFRCHVCVRLCLHYKLLVGSLQ